MLPATLQFLIVMIASSLNERMQKRLEYKSEEVLVLKEILKARNLYSETTARNRADDQDDLAS
ncbi:MAG: hypothetical protein GY811_11015 [Myxococcales bacterium]|nr:hypothetical protein [Myxococcales bacterium]